MRTDSEKVYRDAECREDLGLQSPKKDTFHCKPKLSFLSSGT